MIRLRLSAGVRPPTIFHQESIDRLCKAAKFPYCLMEAFSLQYVWKDNKLMPLFYTPVFYKF